MKTPRYLSLVLAAVFVPALACSQQIVTEKDATKPCLIAPNKPCSGAETGSVLQVWPGEDVHVWRENGKYWAEFYAFGYVFRPPMSRGRSTYDSLAALNAGLAARGFDAVDEAGVMGPCEIRPGEKCRGAETGRVLQKSAESLDVYAVKKDGRYVAEYYAFSHLFEKDQKRNTDSFSTLAGLNTSLEAQGFDPVREADVAGPCSAARQQPCSGGVTGRVMQRLLGKDIHVEKLHAKYLATIYPFGHVFQWPPQGAESFDSLEGLNSYLVGQYATSKLSPEGSLLPLALRMPLARSSGAQPSHDMSTKKGIVVEALVDGDEELHVRADGLYWVNGRFAKPGKHEGQNAPTYVNDAAWLPSWTHAESYGPDKSELYKLDVGSPDLDFELLGVSSARGKKGMDSRDRVTVRRTSEEVVLSIPDGQAGARWYRLSLSRR